MISTKDLANMSVLDLAQMIETRRQETVLIYQAIAAKITKKSLGTAFLKANKLASAEYYLQVAKDHPEILAPTFDVNHFEGASLNKDYKPEYDNDNNYFLGSYLSLYNQLN